MACTYNGLGDRLQQTVNGQTIDYTLDIDTELPNVLSDGLGDLSQTSGTQTHHFPEKSLWSGIV